MIDTSEIILNSLPQLERILQRQPEWLDMAVSTADASQITGIPVTTLVSLRSKGGGPKFVRPAGTRIVRYFRRHLYEWLISGGVKTNTAQDSANSLISIEPKSR